MLRANPYMRDTARPRTVRNPTPGDSAHARLCHGRTDISRWTRAESTPFTPGLAATAPRRCGMRPFGALSNCYVRGRLSTATSIKQPPTDSTPSLALIVSQRFWRSGVADHGHHDLARSAKRARKARADVQLQLRMQLSTPRIPDTDQQTLANNGNSHRRREDSRSFGVPDLRESIART